MFSTDEQYMQRCIQLAEKGMAGAAPNPMVGAVLVHNGRIIGEGWHERYGEAHAEVNCLASVKEEDSQLVSASTLYVSLEPCAHYGKTPPCSGLIIRNQIPKVVIGCTDPFAAVNGKGIEQLRAAGLEVAVGILEKECRRLNKRFFCMQQEKRPYVVLKWAQTADGFIGTGTGERMFISNSITNRKVHQWRTEESAILVGFNTAKLDDPKLDNRLWPGRTPLRIVIDPQLQLPQHLYLFSGGGKTVVLNQRENNTQGQVQYVSVNSNEPSDILGALYAMNIQSVLVEGGAQTLSRFLVARLWDEARVITATGVHAGKGIAAPALPATVPVYEEWILNDRVGYYYNQN